MIVNAAIQEDVDVIALSILSGAHMTIFPKVVNMLKEQGETNILVTGGGIIPKEDMKKLETLGVGRLFGPGSSVKESLNYIQDWVKTNK